MVKNNETNEMTDSEIISLLSEYNFKEKEMAKILKELKSRDFEYVVSYIEDIKSNPERRAREENEKRIKEVKEQHEQSKKEEEIQERYRKQLLEKIEANRIEQKKREEAEIGSSTTVVKSNKVEGYIRVKAVCGNEEILLGLGPETTVDDLYRAIQEKTGSNSIKIRRHGHEEVIGNTAERVENIFKARSIMIDVDCSTMK